MSDLCPLFERYMLTQRNDSIQQRTLPVAMGVPGTVPACLGACYNAGYHLGGVEYVSSTVMDNLCSWEPCSPVNAVCSFTRVGANLTVITFTQGAVPRLLQLVLRPPMAALCPLWRHYNHLQWPKPGEYCDQLIYYEAYFLFR